MLIERRTGILLGANITGGEGGSGQLVLTRQGSKRYMLVDIGQKNPPELSFLDLHKKVVEISDSGSCLEITPGNRISRPFGQVSVAINATSYRGIRLNGHEPT
jgi:hypothetical protein